MVYKNCAISALASCLLLLFEVSAFCQSNQTDSVTITTYYPSPQGVYRTLRFFPTPQPPCGADQEGLMYYNNTAHWLNLCWYNGTAYNWTAVGVGASGDPYWAENAANHNINNTNSGQFVGIGTTTPTEKLTVVGGNITVVNGDVCLSPSGICLSQLP